MPTLFEDWQRVLAPKWLRDGKGDFWLRAFGAQKDGLEQWARDFVLSRFPVTAAVDALQQIGAERGLERPFGEDVYDLVAVWRSKLTRAFERWDHGGTHFGVLRELRGALVGPVSQGGGNILHPTSQVLIYDALDLLVNACIADIGGEADVPFNDPDAFDALDGFSQFAQLGLVPALQFDSHHRWNTFAVLILVKDGHAWHGGVPVDASNEAQQARRIIQRWRAGHAECRQLIVQDADAGGNYDVLWGISSGIGDGNGPVWGAFNWGQAAGVGSSTTYWTPPSPQ